MTELDKILAEIAALKREVAILRAEVRLGKKSSGGRVYVGEIAARFGVSTETVRRMQGEFAALWLTHHRTETNRLFWQRADYEAWLDTISEPVKTKAARQIKKLINRRAKI